MLEVFHIAKRAKKLLTYYCSLPQYDYLNHLYPIPEYIRVRHYEGLKLEDVLFDWRILCNVGVTKCSELSQLKVKSEYNVSSL